MPGGTSSGEEQLVGRFGGGAESYETLARLEHDFGYSLGEIHRGEKPDPVRNR
jgi:hypothetical protein